MRERWADRWSTTAKTLNYFDLKQKEQPIGRDHLLRLGEFAFRSAEMARTTKNRETKIGKMWSGSIVIVGICGIRYYTKSRAAIFQDKKIEAF